MTDREKAIVMAYTGTCMLAGDKLGIYYQYIQDKLGRCIMTHELAYPDVQDAIKEAARDDFIELCRQSDGPRVMTLEEALGGEECWVEYPNGGCGYADCYLSYTTKGADIYRTMQHDFNVPLANYGKTWRCWTSRPTVEQREAAKWDA